MIEVSGCCDGCGKKADRANVRFFTKVPTCIRGLPAEFDLCSDCIKELKTIDGDVAHQVHQLQVNHGRG